MQSTPHGGHQSFTETRSAHAAGPQLFENLLDAELFLFQALSKLRPNFNQQSSKKIHLVPSFGPQVAPRSALGASDVKRLGVYCFFRNSDWILVDSGIQLGCWGAPKSRSCKELIHGRFVGNTSKTIGQMIFFFEGGRAENTLETIGQMIVFGRSGTLSFDDPYGAAKVLALQNVAKNDARTDGHKSCT